MFMLQFTAQYCTVRQRTSHFRTIVDYEQKRGTEDQHAALFGGQLRRRVAAPAGAELRARVLLLYAYAFMPMQFSYVPHYQKARRAQQQRSLQEKALVRVMYSYCSVHYTTSAVHSKCGGSRKSTRYTVQYFALHYTIHTYSVNPFVAINDTIRYETIRTNTKKRKYSLSFRERFPPFHQFGDKSLNIFFRKILISFILNRYEQ